MRPLRTLATDEPLTFVQCPNEAALYILRGTSRFWGIQGKLQNCLSPNSTAKCFQFRIRYSTAAHELSPRGPRQKNISFEPRHAKGPTGRHIDLKPDQPAGRRFGSQPIGPLQRYDQHRSAIHKQLECLFVSSGWVSFLRGLPRGRVWPSSRRASRSFVLASLRALHLDPRLRGRRGLGSYRGKAGCAPGSRCRIGGQGRRLVTGAREWLARRAGAWGASRPRWVQSRSPPALPGSPRGLRRAARRRAAG
jgi:hypothetical protein